MSSRSASTGGSTRSTRSARSSASRAVLRRRPMPTFIPACGRTLHLAGVCVNRIGTDSFTPNGVYVLAGHIATAEDWAKFSREWEAMLPYGIRAKNGGFHFKMSEMTSSPERMERVGAFYRIIDSHDLIPLSCKISIDPCLSG